MAAAVYGGNGDWREHEGGLRGLLVGLIEETVYRRGIPRTPGPNPALGRLGPSPARNDGPDHALSANSGVRPRNAARLTA